MFDWSQVNYLSVVLATVVAMALGFVWYAPFLFGTAWLAELGKRKEDMKSPGLPMVVSIVTAFIMALAMELLFIELGVATAYAAVAWSLVIGVVFVALNTLSDYLYSGLTMKLFVITAGYRVVMFVLVGLTLVLI